MPKKAVQTWEYEAEVVRIIDGDTVRFHVSKTTSVEVDFGFYVTDTVSLKKDAEINFRFAGINTAEIHDEDKARAKKAALAKTEVERLLGLGTIRLVSYKPDKYGRWLADVYVTPPGKKEIHVNQALLDGGFALPYNGKGEKP